MYMEFCINRGDSYSVPESHAHAKLYAHNAHWNNGIGANRNNMCFICPIWKSSVLKSLKHISSSSCYHCPRTLVIPFQINNITNISTKLHCCPADRILEITGYPTTGHPFLSSILHPLHGNNEGFPFVWKHMVVLLIFTHWVWPLCVTPDCTSLTTIVAKVYVLHYRDCIIELNVKPLKQQFF